MKGFKKGMAESGYLEGENITYIYEGATSIIDKLDPIAQSLVEADVDLILSVTTPATQAAQRATLNTDIPIVFVPVTDPVGAGFVKSLRQPGGNMTGVTFGFQEGRRLEWLVQIVPTIEHIYTFYTPDDPGAVLALKTVKDVAPKLGVELIAREVHTPEEIVKAVEQIPEETDAVFLLPDSLASAHSANLIKEAVETRRLPTSGANTDAVREGALTSYGIDQFLSGKQAARLADQILRGTRPADVPVEMAEFHFAINLQTAEAIGLDISDEILFQADIIIR